MIDRKIIKVRTDMFEDTKFKLIDRMKERNLINYVWFRIMTLAGKVNKGGDLYFSTTKPYTVETLAVEFNREESEIELALGVLVDLEIIEVTENNLYRVKNFAKHQGIKSKESTEKNSHIVKDENSVRNKKEENEIKGESKTNTKVNDIDVFENKNELESQNKEIRNNLNIIHEKSKEIDNKALVKEKEYKKYSEIEKEYKEIKDGVFKGNNVQNAIEITKPSIVSYEDHEVIPLLVDVGMKRRKKNKKIENIETIGDIKEEKIEMCGFIDDNDISSLGTPIRSWSF